MRGLKFITRHIRVLIFLLSHSVMECVDWNATAYMPVCMSLWIALCNGVRGLKSGAISLLKSPFFIALCNGVRGLKSSIGYASSSSSLSHSVMECVDWNVVVNQKVALAIIALCNGVRGLKCILNDNSLIILIIALCNGVRGLKSTHNNIMLVSHYDRTL